MKTHANERIARALLYEVDRTFRRCYHQTLTDVIQDLRLHDALRSGDPSPEMLLFTIHEAGLLRMSSSSTVLEMRAVLNRFVGGTINVCTNCGGTIALKDLEQHPTVTLCSRCRLRNETKR